MFNNTTCTVVSPSYYPPPPKKRPPMLSASLKDEKMPSLLKGHIFIAERIDLKIRETVLVVPKLTKRCEELYNFIFVEPWYLDYLKTLYQNDQFFLSCY